MTKTPEGFLVCHDVPIARTGYQDYIGREIGLTDDAEAPVKVYRSPEEVFHPAAIASFEGKSVTNEHPSSPVRPDNYQSHERGHVQSVRRGVGEDEDKLIADLIIKDPTLISQIETGKREVSCGYDCDYEPLDDGTYAQKNIRGNHVAVVTQGRAGPTVAIGDGAPQAPERAPERRKLVGMKSVRNRILGLGWKAFVADADPDEIAEGARAMREEDAETPEPPKITPEPPKTPDADPGDDALDKQILVAVQGLATQMQALTERVAALEEPDPEEDALTQFENELGGKGSDPEAAVTVEPENIHDEAGHVTPPDERAENPIPGADRAAALQTLRAVKPIIAALPEPQRKQATDALVKSLRGQLGAKTSAQPGGYAGIAAAVAANGRATDAKPVDDTQLGRDIMSKYNEQGKRKGAN